MNNNKKYELIPSDKEGLYRVKALKDFNDVKKGDIGGYVECESNLSYNGNCWIYDDAIVRDDARIWGNAQIWGKAVIQGYAEVYSNAQIWGNAVIQDNASVGDKAVIQDNVFLMGNAEVCGNAIISSDKDYIVFKNWWSSGRYFTWTRSNNKWKVGCFYGTGEELVTKAYADNVEKGIEYKKIVDYVESII